MLYSSVLHVTDNIYDCGHTCVLVQLFNVLLLKYSSVDNYIGYLLKASR